MGRGFAEHGGKAEASPGPEIFTSACSEPHFQLRRLARPSPGSLGVGFGTGDLGLRVQGRPAGKGARKNGSLQFRMVK